MQLITRYLTATLLETFFFCLIAFGSLLVVADLFSSLDDFIQSKAGFGLVISYYTVFLPGLLATVLPIALLFASLYTLMKLNRHSELTAMQAGGVSLWRIFFPFTILSLFCTATLYAIVLGPGGNNQARREQIMDTIRGHPDANLIKFGLIYNNYVNHCLWFMKQLDLEHDQAEELEILQRDPQGRDLLKYYVHRATWENGFWTLHGVSILHYDAQGNFTQQENIAEMPRLDWQKPPKEMVTLQTQPDQLSARELWDAIHLTYVQSPEILAPYRTQLFYLIAYPWTAPVLLLFALASGTAYQRRNPAAGVFSAIFLLLAYYVVFHTFIAMGRGARLPAAAAVSLPLLIFALIGLVRLAPRFGFSLPGLPWPRRD